MKDDVESQDPFPDLDASSALRAAFKKRDPSSGGAERAKSATPPAIHVERKGYELEGEIARGGMGLIIKAFDRDLTRDVALKVLRDELAHEPRYVRRFLEEGRVTARLDHPGIVPVHEAGRDAEGRPYFAMRLVRGRDLRRIIELANANLEGWNQTRALSVFLKVCEAMAYAHDKGVIHRDLKPSNVMVGEFGEVYVMDWGLARAIGRDDVHDLRLQEATDATREPRARAATNVAGVDSPIMTMDGEVLGTPCYMSPEQAQGRLAELGPRSDVYSVGAMLYHLLGNEMPYVPPGSSIASRAVLAHLVQGPPQPLHALGRELPDELVAICERAMARDPGDRYPGMLEMAEDLRAFLEQRVVRAYETGAWAEAKKWVRRNTGFAAASASALLSIVCGLVVSLILRAQSDRNAKLARTNEEVATERADDVLRLSALQDLDDLTAEANQLWPAAPEMMPRYDAWLVRARQVVDELSAHEAKLAALRARAVPWTRAEAAESREKHPRLAELVATEKRLEHQRQVCAALESGAAPQAANPAEPAVDFASLPSTALELNVLAWSLVAPERTEWGSEAKGLLIARRALEIAASSPPFERIMIRDTLAWALFANGRYEDALAAEEAGLREADVSAQVERYRKNLHELEKAIDEARGPKRLEAEKNRLTKLEARVAELEVAISSRSEWTFDYTQDKWWHNQLTKLIERLKSFADPEHGLLSAGISPEFGWGVTRRLEFARTIEERSVSGPNARTRWTQAIESIRNTSECPMYHGLTIAPQLGLIPIGRDPASGLWEFAHLQSGGPAERGADGKLVLREETGLVVVLIPGGAFLMGAQNTDPNGPHFDPRAWAEEGPVNGVTLSPFFLSKYEMTQGQWQRATGNNPSTHGEANYSRNWNAAHKVWNAMHALEQVSWRDCSETLARFSLALPTEAQWEYACRAGTDTAYWCGDEPESLQGVDNLSDAYGKAHGNDNWSEWEAWLDDGQSEEGEVGTYRANPFGLYDMHGNVAEWCRDLFDDYGKRVRIDDGEREVISAQNHVFRGGSFGVKAILARSSSREDAAPDARGPNLGVRPARAIAR